MALEIGVVCGRCDRYSAVGTPSCACGHPLSVGTAAFRSEKGSTLSQRSAALELNLERKLSSAGAFDDEVSADVRRLALAHSAPSLEELMDQAKNYVCKSCSTPVPLGHKFCGRCGASIPPEIANARTQFFGQLQVPGKAKLILIRGDGIEGLSYQLNAEQHTVGRNGQVAVGGDGQVTLGQNVMKGNAAPSTSLRVTFSWPASSYSQSKAHRDRMTAPRRTGRTFTPRPSTWPSSRSSRFCKGGRRPWRCAHAVEGCRSGEKAGNSTSRVTFT